MIWRYFSFPVFAQKAIERKTLIYSIQKIEFTNTLKRRNKDVNTNNP